MAWNSLHCLKKSLTSLKFHLQRYTILLHDSLRHTKLSKEHLFALQNCLAQCQLIISQANWHFGAPVHKHFSLTQKDILGLLSQRCQSE